MRRSRFSRLTIALMSLPLSAALACTITEDTVREALKKEGYEVTALGPPEFELYDWSFKATSQGRQCTGNVKVSGIAWFPSVMYAADCGSDPPLSE